MNRVIHHPFAHLLRSRRPADALVPSRTGAPGRAAEPSAWVEGLLLGGALFLVAVVEYLQIVHH